jgi:hypothetical protein
MPGLAESLAAQRRERWAAVRGGLNAEALGRPLVLRGFSTYREFLDVGRPTYLFEWLHQSALAQQGRLEAVVGGAGLALERG